MICEISVIILKISVNEHRKNVLLLTDAKIRRIFEITSAFAKKITPDCFFYVK